MISDDGNTILAPVGLADICRVLRENTVDLGSLCRSKSINKWAKYKPVSNYGLEYEDELNTTRDGWQDTATWWKGTDGQCGIANITAYSAGDLTVQKTTDKTAAQVADEIAAKIAGLFASCWTYNPPSGGSVSPFRAEDFLRYRRTAQSPFGTVTGYPSADIKYYQGGSVLRWVITPHKAESDELSLTDIGRAFGGTTTTIADMWFGMLFVCIKSSNQNNDAVIGKTLLKTCVAALGNENEEFEEARRTLELTTADTVQFASQLANDETRWIAYPILIKGSAEPKLITIAGMNENSSLMFAPYKEAVTGAAKPLCFLPSQYDVQARLVGVGMGTGATDNYYKFELSIVNKSGKTYTVAQLADVELKLKYTTLSVSATDIDWNNVSAVFPSTLYDAKSTSYGLWITRVSAMNGTSRTSLSGGWTVEAGESVTIEGMIIFSPTGGFPDITHAQLSCAIKYSGDEEFTQYAAGQNSYWHKASDGYETAKELTHTAELTEVKLKKSGSQMFFTFTPVVKAKSGTATTEWGVGVLKASVRVRYGKTYTYSFPASTSTSGSWDNGTWTGEDITMYLSPASMAGDDQYVNWEIPSVLTIQGTGGGVDITK